MAVLYLDAARRAFHSLGAGGPQFESGHPDHSPLLSDHFRFKMAPCFFAGAASDYEFPAAGRKLLAC